MTGASSNGSASRLAVGQRGARWGALGAALLALVGFGCGQNPGFGPPPGNGGGGSSGTVNPTGPGPAGSGGASSGGGVCDEGATRDCHLTLDQHGDIVTCYSGTQLCYHGLWSECRGGEYTMKPHHPRRLADDGAPRVDDQVPTDAPQALPHPLNATEQMCVGDPCDPTCRTFIENGYTPPPATTGTTLAWASGTNSSLAQARPTLVGNNTLKQPCTNGSDCQVDEYCSYPVTNSACSHDQCATGPALNATCSTCVSNVCAQNPDCCAYAGPCAHAPCFAGAALTCDGSMPGPIDTCVQTVCADPATAYCCNTTAPNASTAWDATCIAAYSMCRPYPCPSSPATAWSSPGNYSGSDSLACTQLVHDLCGITCPTPKGTCDHDYCITGSPLSNAPVGCDTANSSSCVAAICAAQPSCCSTAWDASCVALVPAVCGKACPAGGVCTPIVQNQVDPTCNGPDLTASIPCYDQPSTPAVPCTTDADCGGTNSGVICNLSKQCQVGCRGSTASGNVCPTGLTCSVGSTSPAYISGTCGSCTTDLQCGSATSGIICNSSSKCQAGCRGTGGNKCPGSQICSSTTSTAGACGQYHVPDPNNPGQYMTTSGNYVPVCNFGTAPTPAGATVYLNVYATGTGGMPAQPAGKNAQVLATCSTTQTILPGRCVDVLCDTSLTKWGASSSPVQVFVNPPDAPPGVTGPYTQIAECNYQNNWTVNLDEMQNGGAGATVTCDAPTCATSAGKVNSYPVHMVIETETSQSVSFGWANIRLGVTNFLLTRAYPTTYAAVGNFPDNTSNSCNCATGCVDTADGMVALTSAGAMLLSGVVPGSVVSATPPPYVAAYTNALNFSATDPTVGSVPVNRAVVLVLASDMASYNPQCGSATTAGVVQQLVSLAANAYATKGIRTFVIAAPPSASVTTQNAAVAIASAGGGRAYYYPNPVYTSISNALADIQNYADGACWYTLPDPTLFSPASTSAWYNISVPSPGGQFPLVNIVPTSAQVAAAKAAGQTYLDACLLACQGSTTTNYDGYCYDDDLPPNGSPTRMVLCPSTCGKVAYDPYTTTAAVPAHGFASYKLGCPSYFQSGVGPGLQPYQGKCLEPGAKPLWTFLAYSASTPSDPSGSPNVTFTVQTANVDPNTGLCPPAGSSLYTAPTKAAVAKYYSPAPPTGWDSQVCAMNAGGVNNCPVDLVNLLNKNSSVKPDGGTPNGAAINGPALADCMLLNIALNTNANHTSAPLLNGYELRYSCPAAE